MENSSLNILLNGSFSVPRLIKCFEQCKKIFLFVWNLFFISVSMSNVYNYCSFTKCCLGFLYMSLIYLQDSKYRWDYWLVRIVSVTVGLTDREGKRVGLWMRLPLDSGRYEALCNPTITLQFPARMANLRLKNRWTEVPLFIWWLGLCHVCFFSLLRINESPFL